MLLVSVDGSTLVAAPVLDETPTKVRAPLTSTASEIPKRITLKKPAPAAPPTVICPAATRTEASEPAAVADT